MALLVLLALLAPPEAALEAAIACYDGLDYTCAEERLAEALAGGLSPADQIRARRHEALLALAFRDEARMRRAARAIFAIQPDWEGSDLPPRLAAIFAEERPLPPPPPRALGRLDVTSLRPTGSDADRWSEGLGVEAAGGVLLDDRWVITLTGAYSDHRPRAFVDQGLGLTQVGLELGARLAFGPVRVQAGVGLGAGSVAVEGALRDESYWGGYAALPVDVSVPLLGDLGVGGRVGLLVYVTSDADRLASSLLVPLTFGLRYGP
ncbi:MAG: hypothetical protein H6706_10170 [Myxococcales bacterium]|nr:hypothetical protein [Myxococcales bacterium]